jgi:hypothetical protein
MPQARLVFCFGEMNLEAFELQGVPSAGFRAEFPHGGCLATRSEHGGTSHRALSLKHGAGYALKMTIESSEAHCGMSRSI